MHRLLLLVLILAPLASCSGDATPVSPTAAPNPAPAPPPPPSGPPRITITPDGFSPREVSIAVGGTVTLVNGDTRVHDLLGGLDHTQLGCPEITNAGFLTPGQSRDAGPFRAAGDCIFHDHAFIGVEAFQGKIVVR